MGSIPMNPTRAKFVLKEMNLLECPKDDCFHWVCPGGSADISNKTHKSIQESLKNGQWVRFPEGGCACTFGKCSRIHENEVVDYFEAL